jgi:hypothetical protein
MHTAAKAPIPAIADGDSPPDIGIGPEDRRVASGAIGVTAKEMRDWPHSLHQ